MMMEAVTATLRDRGSRGWLVGGTIRDRELGRFSPDLDVVVADEPAVVAREIASRLTCPWFALSTRHRAYRVMAGEGHIDVAGVRGAGILEDLAQRDFTINAMAMPVDGGDLVDPFGGHAHLHEKLLVAVSDRIFVDDPLRLMRAARFCHTLALHLQLSLDTLLRSQVSELARVAPERIAMEMTLTLAQSPSTEAVGLWAELGLLEAVLPEASPSWASEGQRTLSVLERLDHAFANAASWFPLTVEAVSERLADAVDGMWTRTAALRLAAVTRPLPPEQVSVAAHRLRLSAAMLSLLQSASAGSRAGRCGLEMLVRSVRSPRAGVQFLWDSAPWEPELILLAVVDPSALPEDEPAADALPAPEILNAARELMASWADRSSGGAPRLPLGGETLMRELSLSPGPRLGEVLREVRLAWEAGEVTTAVEAIELAKTLVWRS